MAYKRCDNCGRRGDGQILEGCDGLFCFICYECIDDRDPFGRMP